MFAFKEFLNSVILVHIFERTYYYLKRGKKELMRVLFVKIKKLFIILFEWEISINDNFIQLLKKNFL